MYYEEETIFKDKDLVCLCGEAFVWTAGEQEFMQSLMDNGKISSVQTPKRCAKCRLANKRARENSN